MDGRVDVGNRTVRWAIRQKTGGGGAKAALWALAELVKDDDACVVAAYQKEIAELAEVQLATVTRALKTLEEAGIVRRLSLVHAAGQMKTCSLYLLSLSPFFADRPADLARFLPERTRFADGVENEENRIPQDEGTSPQNEVSDNRGVARKTEEIRTPHFEGSIPQNDQEVPSKRGDSITYRPEEDSPPTPPSGGDCLVSDQAETEDQRFERFWAKVPKRRLMDRQRARRAFGKLDVDEQRWALAAVEPWAAELGTRAPLDAHKWLERRIFANYPRPIAQPPPAAAQPSDLSWAAASALLRKAIGDEVFASWFGHAQGILAGDTARLVVGSRFVKSRIEADYHDRLLACWRAASPVVQAVEVVVGQATAPPDPTDQVAEHVTGNRTKAAALVERFDALAGGNRSLVVEVLGHAVALKLKGKSARDYLEKALRRAGKQQGQRKLPLVGVVPGGKAATGPPAAGDAAHGREARRKVS